MSTVGTAAPPARVVVHTALSVVVAAALLGPAPAHGQSPGGSTASTLGGMALGAYSGTVLGLVGGAGVCNRLLVGAACPRFAAVAGGGVGLGAGAVLGSEDPGAIEDRFRSAGYGALVGGLAGLGLTYVVRPYAWPDPLAFAAVGAAIGASPEGAAVGLVAGAAVGTVGWMTHPRLSVGDAITFTLLGLAVGGVVGWVVDGATASPRARDASPAQGFQVSFSIPAR